MAGDLTEVYDFERGADQPELNTPIAVPTEDGFLVDPESGEVMGSVDPAPEQTKDRIDWYLRRRCLAEAHAEALTHEMNLIIAGVRERFETRIRDEQRKVEWLDANHKEAAKSFAIEQLAFSGKAGKTFKHAWGNLCFRASRESTSIVDEGLAITHCAEHCPDAVTVSVPLAALDKKQRSAVMAAEGATAKVFVSRIPGPMKPELPAEAFAYKAAGAEQEFDIKHEARGSK